MTGLNIAIRSVHLGASLFLAGLFTFLLLVARPAFQTEKAEGQSAFGPFDDRMLRVAGWSLLVLLLTGLLGLLVQLATVTGRPLWQALTPLPLWNLLTSTQYGRVWIIRIALMTLLGGLLWLRDQERDSKDWWALRLEGMGLAVSMLVAQAWMGHSATGAGLTLLYQVLADSLHLFAGGVWLGSLPLLAVLLSWAQRSDDPNAENIAAAATRRFSALGLASMSLLILSGLANAWELVGTIPALLGTTYGRLLSLKVSLLLPLLTLAALNLLRNKPRLLQAVAGSEPRDIRPVLRRLRRNVLGELFLGGFILLLVGALGVMPPALHDQPSWPFSFRLSWEATKDLPGVRTSAAIGMQVSMFGLFAALIPLLTRIRHWPWVAAAGLVTVGVGFALWLPKLSVDAYPTTYVRPLVPYTALSIANGLQLYHQHCAICHGEEGYGDGPAAARLRPRPADLTAKHTADHTAGDIFWWLTRGMKGTAMPGFQDQLSDEERWDVINVVRILAAAEQARALGPLIASDLRVVAPDFAYTTPLGDTRALKDLRGQAQVLLVGFTLPDSLGRLAQLRDLYPRVRVLGTEILAIPLRSDHADQAIDEMVQRLRIPFMVLTEGSGDVSETYGLFRRSLNPETSGGSPMPGHLEWLIDRQGYLRGRWIPNEGTGWAQAEPLIGAIEQLQREKLEAPPPDLHVH